MEFYEVNFNCLKKKLNICNFIMVINWLMVVLNFLNSLYLFYKIIVEIYIV